MLAMAQGGEQAVCFVNEDVTGFLYLIRAPLHFNLRISSANELGFWGRDGRALIQAGKAWAKAQGISRLMMGSEDQIRGKAMERFYRSQGLEPVGRSFQMRLE